MLHKSTGAGRCGRSEVISDQGSEDAALHGAKTIQMSPHKTLNILKILISPMKSLNSSTISAVHNDVGIMPLV